MQRIMLTGLAALLGATACDAESPAAPRYLFDLDDNEIVEIVDHFDPDGDVDRALVQMQAPFRCGNFPGACETHGQPRAKQLVESIWAAARMRGTADDLLHHSAQAVLAGPTALPRLPAPTAVSGDDSLVCLQSVFFIDSVQLEANFVDLGLVVFGSASYASTTSGGDLIVTTTDNSIDADLELTVTNGAGTTVASQSSSFANAAEGSISVGFISSAKTLDGTATLTTDSIGGLGSCDETAEVVLTVRD